MRRLEKKFNKAGFEFRMFCRTKNAAIYELWRNRASDRKLVLYGYEVHEIRVSPANERRLPNGKILKYPEMENLAGTSEFGLFGWSYDSNDLAGAERKYNWVNRRSRA